MKFEYYGWDDGTALYHYGISGQKWGIRRFQNPDGTLTEAGKKRYLSDPDKSYKRLRKDIRNKRSELYGKSNRWRSTTEIGENSKRVREISNKNYEAYVNSPEYKKWESGMNKREKKAEKDFYSGKMSEKEYDKQFNEWIDKRPKQNYNTVSWGTVGGKYLDNYLERGGKDLSVARLMDLGFEKKTAEMITKRIAKLGKTLATV